MNGVIEAPHYEQTRKALMKDPIIQNMAQALVMDPQWALNPQEFEGFWFINAASQAYNEFGGKIPHHIGGPSEAILRLIDYWENYKEAS